MILEQLHCFQLDPFTPNVKRPVKKSIDTMFYFDVLGNVYIACKQIFTARIRRIGKVLFSQVRVCPQGRGGTRITVLGEGVSLVSGPSSFLGDGDRYPVLVLVGGGVP